MNDNTVNASDAQNAANAKKAKIKKILSTPFKKKATAIGYV